MKILFLMITYPNVKISGSMYTDLAEEFQNKGHDVFVATANGPAGFSFKTEGKVKVLRIRTLQLFNTSLFKKGLGNLLLPFQVIRGIKKYLGDKHFDTVIVSTPPITYLTVLRKLKKDLDCSIYLILRDIFPQNAKDIGLIRNELLFKYFRKQEKKLYAVADFIGCMSAGNIEYIKKMNPEICVEKLHLLLNWKNITEIFHRNHENTEFSKSENKFIIIYGGNLGKPQDVDFIIEIAENLCDLSDVNFYIIGEGTEKNRMIRICKNRKLHNIKFFNPLPRDEYENLVKICDIGLIINNRHFTIPNIPSRVLSYWEAKIPVIAALDPYTDFGDLLKLSGSGLWSLTGDVPAFRKNFEMLYREKSLRTEMGEKGYNFLVSQCSVNIAYETIFNKINHNR